LQKSSLEAQAKHFSKKSHSNTKGSMANGQELPQTARAEVLKIEKLNPKKRHAQR
jgi:hypothetical protein